MITPPSTTPDIDAANCATETSPKMDVQKALILATSDAVYVVYWFLFNGLHLFSSQMKIVSEYDQEIPKSQTVDNPMAPQRRAAQQSRDTRKTN